MALFAHKDRIIQLTITIGNTPCGRSGCPEPNMTGLNELTDRRTVLKTLGAGVTIAGTGLGMAAFAGSAAAGTVNITATNPASITNDRGDLSRVTIDPTFRVEWENMDTAVAKVFYVIEGRTRDNGNWSNWSPLFRSTPWLTPGSLQGADSSKPGTTGYLEFTDPLSAIMNRSSADRDAKDEDPRALPRPIEVVNELGRPDYEGSTAFDDHPQSVDSTSYLNGDSVGTADNATKHLDDWVLSREEGDPIETGDSSFQNEPDADADLPLVNNFPGAESGYYGAADNTERFDVEEDGQSDTDTVQIRYTFAFQTLDEGSVQYFVSGDFANDYGSDVETAVREDPHLENVRPADVVSGNSEFVMDGSDGYPSITNNGATSTSANDYSAYQAVAGSHPAAISTTTQFAVTVDNETADSGVTGDSGSGAEGGGQ